MFEKLDMAPADPILGLSAAFKSDNNPQKSTSEWAYTRMMKGKHPSYLP